MTKKIALVVLLIIIQSICFATIFSPLSFEKQIEEASSAAEVRLKESRVFKNASGLIMTEYVFDVLESYNLSDDDLTNQTIRLSMPGGTYQGVTSMIDGAPRFNQNERSFLLFKKINSQIYLSNFTLGKFKIQNYKGKVYYVSEVFPMDPKIGRISKESMIELMKNKWKITLMIPKIRPAEGKVLLAGDTRPIVKNINDLERGPAQKEVINQEAPVFFWGATILLAFFFLLIFFKSDKSE